MPQAAMQLCITPRILTGGPFAGSIAPLQGRYTPPFCIPLTTLRCLHGLHFNTLPMLAFRSTNPCMKVSWRLSVALTFPLYWLGLAPA